MAPETNPHLHKWLLSEGGFMVRTLSLSLAALLLAAGGAYADTYVLVLKSGVIADTKRSGYGWDVWPVTAPEPLVRVSVFEKKSNQQVDFGATDYLRNTHTPVWNRDLAQVFEGDLIRVEVWDKDLKYDDLVAKYSFTLRESMIQNRVISLSFGQVTNLRFELRPVR